MPRPFQIFSQSDYLIWILAINSHTKWKTVQIQISWLLQLIWIYTVSKGRVYPGSVGPGLRNDYKPGTCSSKTHFLQLFQTERGKYAVLVE